VDKENKPAAMQPPAAKGPQSDQSVDEFFTRLQSDMRRPDLSQEAISAAFQAIQKLALETDAEETANVAAPPPRAGAQNAVCPACRTANLASSRFCAACGVPLQSGGGEMPAAALSAAKPVASGGDHHYHHHYHHHYFQAGNGVPQAAATDVRSGSVPPAGREAARQRVPLAGGTLSRAETAVRKISQDWAQACNTKHLDDLVDLYSTDALVLRPNFPPVRGTAAIREFFFSALDAGLGEAEMDPIRVELFGDVAYESGRCKTLVPTSVGKRREERGKYLLVFVREPGGDWKTVADCWNSDLSLGLETAVPSAPPPGVRPQRK
jgi:ketosteroid isomerase-like protein